MFKTPEEFAAANKASVDALLAVANAQFAAFERLSALNFNTTKAAFEDSVKQAKALLSVKDAQGFANLGTGAAQPAIEKAIAYSRSLYEVATQTQAEITKLAESQAEETNKTIAALLDNLAKNAPAGSDAGVAALKSALTAANAAYGNFSKVVKQATSIAEKNANAAAEKVVKASGKKKAT
jgi:phasin family protein